MTTTTWTKAERFDGEGALIAAGPAERTPAPEVAAAVAQSGAETNAWLAED